MFQTTSYRKKPMFKKKRKLRLRYVALPAIALAVGMSAAALLEPQADTRIVSVTEEAAPVEIAAATSAMPVAYHQNDDFNSLQSAFGAAPPAPSADYMRAADSNPLPAPQGVTPVTTGFAMIQSGIATLIDRGTGGLTEKRVSVDKGDTLMGVLVEKASLSRSEAYDAIEALRDVYDPRDLNPKHEITILMSNSDSRAVLEGIRIEKDILSTVTLNRTTDGFTAGETQKAVTTKLAGARGEIRGSLYGAAAAQGIPDSVILSTIKVLSYTVDFQRDIQPGDAFEIMYDQSVTEDGEVLKSRGELVYAKMIVGGKPVSIYRHEDGSGHVDYFDENGKSQRKSLLSTPIDGARISSGYGMRKHPVLGYSKMHKGMDFAAPSGTPIYAAGDGTIEYLGRFSSYGNYIRIRHQSGYKTAYAHMKGFKSGLKNGAKVRQGDVIGYVGTTGRSTGPHLHYEVLLNGSQVNPKSIKMPSGTSLAGNDLKKFKRNVADIQSKMAAIGGTTKTVASAR